MVKRGGMSDYDMVAEGSEGREAGVGTARWTSASQVGTRKGVRGSYKFLGYP